MAVLKKVYWLVVHPVLKRLAGLSNPQDKIRLIRQQRPRVLVETGTYQGDTVAGCLDAFDTIYTIELDPVLWRKARERFAGQNVQVIRGDSAQEIQRLCDTVREPVVFWLDAHSCGPGTAAGPQPLRAELEAIVGRGQADVVLIDDARHMGAPATRFQQWVRDRFLDLQPTWGNTPTLREIWQITGEVPVVRQDIITIRLAGRTARQHRTGGKVTHL